MKKELGDVTLRELAEECDHHEECNDCPLFLTELNCWNSFKMLRDGMLDTEVDI